MPAKTARQQRFMGSRLAAALKRSDKRDPQTGMSASKLREMARGPRKS